MMHRTEWEKELADKLRTSSVVPADVHEGIESLLANLPQGGRSEKRRSRRPWAIVATAAAAVLVAGGASLFAGSDSFAETVKMKLQSIFAASGNPALMQEGQAGEMGVLLEKSDKSYTLRVHEAMFDGQRLSFSYSVMRPEGFPKELWVRPVFELDPSIKKEYPGIVMTDSGETQGDAKTGIVNYYFSGKAPDELLLKIRVPALAVFDDPGDQKLLPGDWSFQLPVAKQGEPVRELTGLPKADDEDVHFEAARVRTASRSTLWTFHWEYPNSWLPNPIREEDPRYNIRYVIEAGGTRLTYISLNTGGSGRLKKQGKVVEGFRYRTDTLVTEQLPKGATEATVTPILRTWTKDNPAGYTEKPLEPFVLRIPVPAGK